MRRAVATLAIGLLMVVGWAVVRRHEVVRALLQAGARLAGYGLELGDLRVAGDGMTIAGLRLSRDGKPLLDARRIDVRYDLRELLPGSSHRFGLKSIDVDEPVVTISRDAEGNFNLPVPAAGNAGPSLPRPPDRVPLRFSFALRNGAVELRAPQAEPGGRVLRVGSLDARGEIDSAGLSHYVLTGAFETTPREPFRVTGRMDVNRGFALHDARAARIPVRELSDFFITSDAADVLSGSGTNFDGRLYALGITDAFSGDYHASVSVDASDVSLALSLMALPIEHVSGHVDVIDDAFFARNVDATIAKSEFHASGSIFDFADPKIQLAIDGAGDLNDLREAFTFAKTQPVGGMTTLHVALSGSLDDPFIAIHAAAPHARYQNIPFHDMRASVAINHDVVAFIPLRASYGGVDVAVRGALDLSKTVGSHLVVHLSAPADRLPYLGELLGGDGVVGDAILSGTDLRFHARGAFASMRGVDRLGALAVADPNGTVAIAPFRVHVERGVFDGGYTLDRPHDTSAFFGYASDVVLHAPSEREFPGLTLPDVPPIDTRVTDAQIAGTGSGRHVAIAGALNVAGASISGVAFDRIRASFAGTMNGAQITSLDASGPWGSFSGNGAFSTKALVARGAFDGTLDGLQPFLGGIPAHGAVSGNAAIALENDAVVVQAENLALTNATIHGIPIERVNGTMSVRDGTLRVYGAQARTAGGDVVAAGTFFVGPGRPSHPVSGLSLIASGLDGAQLHGLGLPLTGGRLSSAGTLQPGSPLPGYDGTFALSAGRAGGVPIAGTGVLALAGNGVKLASGLVGLGGAFAFLHGTISDLSSAAPAYALQAHVPAADVADSLHALHLPNYRTEGTFSADLAVTGRGLDPHVRGPVTVGGGDVNGLDFVDGRALIDADAAAVSASNGGVRVATTYTRFDALAASERSAIRVDAPVADLSDFNNFFDTGDTLDGSGSIAFHANVSRDGVHSGGNVDVLGFRYRNLPIGDTRAQWSSAGGTLTGSLAVGGEHGRLDAHGSIGIVPAKSWQSTVLGSRYDLSATMSNLDLSLWIAAFGFPQIPITGRADGEARVTGRYPALSIRGSTSVLNGTFGSLPIDRFAISGHSDGNLVEIDDGSLTAPGLLATASGTFGLRPQSPLDLRVHASTDDIPELLSQISHSRAEILGSAELTVVVAGTLRTPAVSGAFDAQKVSYRGVDVDSIFGQLRLKGSTLDLSNAGAVLGGGQVSLAGSLPLQLDPFGVGPQDHPLSFDFQIAGVNPNVVAPLLGNGTKLGGEIDGQMGMDGTVGNPRIFGSLGLKNGSYVSDLQRTPVTDTVATIAFDNQRGELTHFSSRLGNGTLDAHGHITLATGGNAIFALDATASNAQLDFPAYGSGTLDGKFRLERTAHHDALLSGKATLTDTTMLFSAFAAAAQAHQDGGGGPQLPLNVGLDLNVTAGNNVRVRGGSGFGAGLDIGATGSLAIAGSLADPTLAGTIASTGGTLTYFDRSFRVQSGSVVFKPSDGLVPTLNAVATTHVVNPDPDPRRNPFGSADVTIKVEGRVDALNIDFDSNPPGYSKEQILALIAPFGGFVAPIAFDSSGPYPTRTANTITVGQEAFNILNAQFSSALLAPLESALGRGLGLSDVNLTLSYYGNVGFSARRVLGKTVTFTFTRTFGIPSYQAFGLIYNQGGFNSATLSLFNQSGGSRLTDQSKTEQYPGAPLAIGQPIGEGSGFSFTYQRLFR